MVPVALARATGAPAALDSASVSVSSASLVPSPIRLTVTNFSVSPAAKVRLPLVAV